MTRLGTCRHCFQIQEKWIVPMQDGERHQHVPLPEDYTCQFLDSLGIDLPGPVRRKNGGLHIRGDDCDVCLQYEPATPTPRTLQPE